MDVVVVFEFFDQCENLGRCFWIGCGGVFFGFVM